MVDESVSKEKKQNVSRARTNDYRVPWPSFRCCLLTSTISPSWNTVLVVSRRRDDRRIPKESDIMLTDTIECYCVSGMERNCCDWQWGKNGVVAVRVERYPFARLISSAGVSGQCRQRMERDRKVELDKSPRACITLDTMGIVYFGSIFYWLFNIHQLYSNQFGFPQYLKCSIVI